ncbi:hypothetical protein Tco_1255932 [Tanacetum coccineum]
MESLYRLCLMPRVPAAVGCVDVPGVVSCMIHLITLELSPIHIWEPSVGQTQLLRGGLLRLGISSLFSRVNRWSVCIEVFGGSGCDGYLLAVTASIGGGDECAGVGVRAPSKALSLRRVVIVDRAIVPSGGKQVISRIVNQHLCLIISTLGSSSGSTSVIYPGDSAVGSCASITEHTAHAHPRPEELAMSDGSLGLIPPLSSAPHEGFAAPSESV